MAGFRAKFGLPDDNDTSKAFIKTSLETLAKQEVDFTLFFRHLTRVAAGEADRELIPLFNDADAAERLLTDWRTVAAPETHLETMRAVNPILIPRNHRIEEAIQAGYQNDFAPFHRLVDALAHPFAEDTAYSDLEKAPQPEERVTETFCGT